MSKDKRSFFERLTGAVRMDEESPEETGRLSTDGRGAFQDPTHIAFWNENSFWYYTDPQYAKYVPEITARFQVSRLVSYFPGDWHRANNISYVKAHLIATKDGARQGGWVNW